MARRRHVMHYTGRLCKTEDCESAPMPWTTVQGDLEDSERGPDLPMRFNRIAGYLSEPDTSRQIALYRAAALLGRKAEARRRLIGLFERIEPGAGLDRPALRRKNRIYSDAADRLADGFTAESQADEGIAFFHRMLAKNPGWSVLYRGLCRLTFPGDDHVRLLKALHENVQPKFYVEIGVSKGVSISVAGPATDAVGVDPMPQIAGQIAAEHFDLHRNQRRLLRRLRGAPAIRQAKNRHGLHRRPAPLRAGAARFHQCREARNRERPDRAARLHPVRRCRRRARLPCAVLGRRRLEMPRHPDGSSARSSHRDCRRAAFGACLGEQTRSGFADIERQVRSHSSATMGRCASPIGKPTTPSGSN